MTLLIESWSQTAWAHLWQVTVLIVAVAMVVRLAARSRPHLAHGLWLIVLVKCITPPLLCSTLGVFCWIPALTSNQTVLPTRWTQVDIATTDSPSPETRTAREPVATEPHASRIAGDLAATLTLAGRRPRLTTCLFGVWLLGTVAALAVTGAGLVAGFLRLRRVGTAADPLLDELAGALAQRLGLRRRVPVVVTDSQFGPAVCGLLRPVVLVPETIARCKTPQELEPILAHELIHVRRGDLWVGLLATLVRALWWFHPLVWWAVRSASREAERCCDEAVLAQLACSPARYARSLLDVLERKRMLKPLAMFPGVRAVELTSKRLERIMRLGHGSHKRSPWWCWAVIALAAAVTLPGAAFDLSAEEPSGLSGAQAIGAGASDVTNMTASFDGPATAPAARPNENPATQDAPPGRGSRRIAVDARWIAAPTTMIDALEVRWARLEEVCPAASEDPLAGLSDKALGESRTTSEEPAGTARSFRVRNVPLRLAILEDEEVEHLLDDMRRLADADLQRQRRGTVWQQVGRLVGYTSSPRVRERVSVIQAPRVTVLDGQKCAINDLSQSPFVVSVQRIRGPFAEALQPVIQVIDEGLKLQLQPQVSDNDSVQLDCELTWSRILDVDTFTFDLEGDNGATIQIPDVEVTRLKAAARVPAGETLLIGGLDGRDRDGGSQSMLIMLRPTEIGPQTTAEQAESSSPSTASEEHSDLDT